MAYYKNKVFQGLNFYTLKVKDGKYVHIYSKYKHYYSNDCFFYCDEIKNLYWIFSDTSYIIKKNNTYILYPGEKEVNICYTRPDINCIIYQIGKEIYINGTETKKFYYVKNNLFVSAAGCQYSYNIPFTKEFFSSKSDIKWTYDGEYKFITEGDVNHVVSNEIFFKIFVDGNGIYAFDDLYAKRFDFRHHRNGNITIEVVNTIMYFYLDDVSFIEQYYRFCTMSGKKIIGFNNISIIDQESRRGYGNSVRRVFFDMFEKELISGPLILCGDKTKVNESYHLWKKPFFINCLAALIVFAIENGHVFSFYFPIEIFKDYVYTDYDIAHINKFYYPDMFKSLCDINDEEKDARPFIYHGVEYDSFMDMVKSYLFGTNIFDKVGKIMNTAHNFPFDALLKISKVIDTDYLIGIMSLQDEYKEKIVNVVKTFTDAEKEQFIKNVHGSTNNLDVIKIIVENREHIKFQTCVSTVYISDKTLDDDILKIVLTDPVNLYYDP